jgi:type IX secretion system PorP/SprF family membrane protein
MKKYIFYILLNIPLAAFAQLQPLFTIYREQTATLNPAMPSTNYLISEFGTTVSVTGRYQWIGIEGAPVTQALNWETMFDNRNLLIGAHIVNDKTGAIGNTSLFARFAYKLVLNDVDKRFISIGFNVGGTNVYENLADVAAKENIITPTIPNKSTLIPDVSLGVFYNEGNRFYAGVSVPQLLGSSFDIDGPNNKTFSFQRTQHIYGIVGGYIDAPFFGNDAAFIEPTAWVRYIPSSKTLSYDLNVRTKISQTFWFGAGYNNTASTLNVELGSVLSDAIGLSDGQLKIGMGYAIPLGSLINLGQTAEVHISYSWGK